MDGHPVQVPVGHYCREDYLNLIFCVNHWHQAHAVSQANPARGRVLEIGPGSGHTTWILRYWGFPVVTADLDPQLRPDVAADLTRLPFGARSFECVLAAEVLEHLPFEEFARAVGELARVSRRHVILTLPAPLIGFHALLNLPGLRPLGLRLGLPFWVRHRFDGEHYWEIGKRGTPRRRIIAAIESQGLRVVRAFRPAPSLYSYFFIAEKR